MKVSFSRYLHPVSHLTGDIRRNVTDEFVIFSTLVWILPVYQHMYVGKRKLEEYDHRLAMCHLCFTPQSSARCRVRVLSLEREAFNLLCAVSTNEDTNCTPIMRLGTVDIIKLVKSNSYHDIIQSRCLINNQGNNRNDIDIHLVLGLDTYRDLVAGKWKDANM